MSFDDLFGVEEPSRQPIRYSPPGTSKGMAKKPLDAVAAQREELGFSIGALDELKAGVSVTWLAKVFRMDRLRIQAALEKCPTVGMGHNGGNLYDVKTAASYLVESQSFEGQLLTIDPKRLPQRLQEGFWNARTKEMKARAMAGELWPTSKVLEVLGDTFQTIKSTVQLWADTIEEQIGEMTPEQRDALVALSDKLLDDINKSLVTQAKTKATPSWAAELDAD